MIRIDREKCIRCGTCVNVCPQATIEMGFDTWPEQVAPESCMDCGVCAQSCQGEAIEINAGVGCFNALLRETSFGDEAGCG
jgi:NAD-dependent dihydropyrimidine dehydrogenase PreA subunit